MRAGDHDSPDIADAPFSVSVSSSDIVYSGPVAEVRRETFDFAGKQVIRDFSSHPGSVGVVALRKEAERLEILLVRQYRHPAGLYMWELPAGLRDVDGETAAECARRELSEETGHDASTLEPLLELAMSPGGSDEVMQIFATWNPIPKMQWTPPSEAEESDMIFEWIDLMRAQNSAMNGHIKNAAAIAGILAAAHRFGT